MSRLFRPLSLFLLVAFATVALVGCMPPKKTDHPGDPRDLQFSLMNFHKELRWARYEQASYFIDESYRHTFLGRYEELGEDFRITDLTVKKVEIEEGEAEVDVEQEWYSEATLVVKKERYVELWRTGEQGQWLLHERTPRDEYRERKKAEKAEEARKPAPAAPPSDAEPRELPGPEAD